jgi:CTP synthase
MSWTWKGIVSASLGSLLKKSWYGVEIIKCDPYIQIDAGTMSPYEHGEVFVTYDGWEVDLDFGHYERFLDQQVMFENSITTGQIYQSVISKERKGEYLGQTVQVIPHIVDEVKLRIHNVAKKLEDHWWSGAVVIIEIWWTVGDIEGPHFTEAVRQLSLDVKNVVQFVHVAPLVRHSYNSEVKTKPLQHSIQKLREIGIIPNFVVTRTPREITEIPADKISLLCGVPPSHCIHCPDRATIYQVPIDFQNQGFDKQIQEWFGREYVAPSFDERKKKVQVILEPSKSLNICLAGKYTELEDCYLSVVEACAHAGVHFNTKVKIKRLDTSEVEKKGEEYIKAFFKENEIGGVIVPGWFGERGVEGMIQVAKYAREQKVPYLGICLGLQVAVIEYARNVLWYKDAHSTEFNASTPHPVIAIMETQKEIENKGGTMRLWHYEAHLDPASKIAATYGTKSVVDRHRHRYEVNPEYHEALSHDGDLRLCGCSEDRMLVEYIEYSNHPYFVATQAHPEFESSFLDPQPLFRDLIKASLQW